MFDLRCEDIAKNYRQQALLSHIDLTVAHGTMTAILGASGSGKTTLLRIMMGFLRADRGTITLGDTVVADAPDVHVRPEARAIGYVAQEGALFPHLTIAENVGFGLARHERRSSPRITEALELVGLSASYERRYPHEISGGEQRRVALARALAPRPKMVLFDEPFSELDAGLRLETRNAVLAALAQEETTSLLVTHDQGEAMSMGSQVAVLQNGTLAQTAPPDVLYHAPVSIEVARFVGDAVILPATRKGRVVESVLGPLEASNGGSDGPVLMMIRPEQICVTHTGGPTAQVTGVTYFGPDTVARLELSVDETKYLLNARIFSLAAPKQGETVSLEVSGQVMTYPPNRTG